MNLQKNTLTLKKELNQLLEHYQLNEAPKDLRDKEFFQFVKMTTNPTYELLDIWEEEALEQIKKHQLRVHPHQVVSTKENMELLLMHSYYVDVKEKRYMELNYSIHYVLDILLEDLVNLSES